MAKRYARAKWCLNCQNVDSLELSVGRAGDLRVGLVATHGLGAVEIGVDTRIHFVQKVGLVRTSRVRGISSTGQIASSPCDVGSCVMS